MFGWLKKGEKRKTERSDDDAPVTLSIDPATAAAVPRLTQLYMEHCTTEQGVHVESLLVALGSVAGFACQAGIRKLAEAGAGPDLVEATTHDGGRFYFGDALNAPLAESPLSVLSVCLGAVQQAGGTTPDIEDIFRHTAQSIGTAAFGQPRYPGQGRAACDPIDYVRDLWPATLSILDQTSVGPTEWHLPPALVFVSLLPSLMAVITPEDALTIVMEAAIPMSKIDLQF